MDVKKYIESGILELYVLGKVSEGERQEVERYAEQHEEIRTEIDAIGNGLEEFSLLHQVKPSANTYQNIKDRITVDAPEVSTKSTSIWGILFGILFVLAMIGMIIFWGKSNRLQGNLQELQVQLDSCQTEQTRSLDRINQLEPIYALENDPKYEKVFLLGVPDHASSLASVYHNVEEGKTFLRPLALQSPETGKQYQLWALVNGTPVNMNVFDLPVDSNGLIEVPFIPDAGTFAITLEPAGGLPAPTLTELRVIGNVCTT